MSMGAYTAFSLAMYSTSYGSIPTTSFTPANSQPIDYFENNVERGLEVATNIVVAISMMPFL
jgi:hypothetical protein